MESAKIERLLEVYFEGNTTLEQELTLRSYFTEGDVAVHLEAYIPIFEGFVSARNEVSGKEISLPESGFKIKTWWYGVAAMLIVAFSVGSMVFSNSGLTGEEQDALAALNETRETMLLFSSSLNMGTASMAHLNEFTKGTSNILYINQFSEAKNKFLK